MRLPDFRSMIRGGVVKNQLVLNVFKIVLGVCEPERCLCQYYRSRGLLVASRDDRLQVRIVMVRACPANGANAKVEDARRAVVCAGLFVLRLPYAAALDQTAAHGAAVDAVHESHQVRTRDWLIRDVENEGRAEMETMQLADSMAALVNFMQLVVVALLRLPFSCRHRPLQDQGVATTG